MTELHVMDIKDCLNEPIDEYLYMFSPERQESILRHKSLAARNRTVWAELLSRHVIAQRTGHTLEIRRENGRPYVDGLFISISHSGEYVACTVGECPNGVDIEKRRAERRVARYFTPEEQAMLDGLDDEGFVMEFLRIWTLKESYAKCTGIELMRVIREVNCLELREKRAGLSGRNFVLRKGYVIGACCDHEFLPYAPLFQFRRSVIV